MHDFGAFMVVHCVTFPFLLAAGGTGFLLEACASNPYKKCYNHAALLLIAPSERTAAQGGGCMVDIDYFYFVTQRERNAAWQLLCANNAPVVLTFMHEAFIKQGRTSAPESELLEILRDIIFKINGGRIAYEEQLSSVLSDVGAGAASGGAGGSGAAGSGSGAGSGGAGAGAVDEDKDQGSLLTQDPIYYLRRWSSEQLRYFRCSYVGASGTEPYYDITPEMQKAYSFVVGMHEDRNSFVPTESRFKELLEILKEVHMSTEGNAQMYLDDLLAQRAALDEKIEKARRGEIATLTPSQIRERFLQFQHDALELVDDFRQVEYNLGNLDKEIMQDILSWTGPRGELLDKYFDQNAYIENTDQGRSFKAFSRLLLSSAEDELIVKRIDNLLRHEAVAQLYKDERIRNIHDQWLELRLNIERVMGASTKRIKSFLQPANLNANRFLKERIKSITDKVVELTNESGITELPESLIELELPRAEISLPWDRPLATIASKAEFNTETKADTFNVDDHRLFEQIVIDPEMLYMRIEEFLSHHDEVALFDIVSKYPLEHGIAELTTYVKLALNDYEVTEDPEREDTFRWQAFDPDGNLVARVASIKHITIRRLAP